MSLYHVWGSLILYLQSLHVKDIFQADITMAQRGCMKASMRVLVLWVFQQVERKAAHALAAVSWAPCRLTTDSVGLLERYV